MFSKSALDAQIPNFISYLKDDTCQEDYLLYEVLHAWSNHWNIEELALSTVFDQSLSSTISNRLWRSQDYEPKQMMISFIEFDKEMVRLMFKDLFNEVKTLDLRIQRFIFHCDQMFEEYRKTHPSLKLRSHYHDYHMVSLYLYFNHPERYTVFDEKIFIKSMVQLGAKNISTTVSLDSYFKIGSILGKFLNENDALTDTVIKILGDRKIKYIKSNAITTIFMTWLSKR